MPSLTLSQYSLSCLVLGLVGCSASQDDSGIASAGSAGLGNHAGSGGSTPGASAGTAGASGAATGGSAGTSSTAGNSAAGGSGGTPSTGAGGSGVGGFAPDGTPPDLEPGVWRDITPAEVSLSGTFGVTVVEIDPNNTAVLYLNVDQQGMWKSENAGATWTLLGDPNYEYTYNHQTKYLDSPVEVRVDPSDSKHLVATQGVRGATLGFWVSTDGGDSWAMPPGFIDVMATATNDVTTASVDPTDFNHIVVSSHSAWGGDTPAGILETTDGGQTFSKRAAGAGWGGSLGVNFLYAPELGIGNAQTWLVSTQQDGFWRTTDSGSSWTQVATLDAVHGGNRTLYFTQAGVIYAGANRQMARSTDQGLSWTLVGPEWQDGYYQVIGDGNLLYAQVSNTGSNTVGPQPYVTSPETDGVTWTPYQGGAQTFSDGPFTMRFDPVNRIIYSANWNAGLWALKVLDP